MKTNRTVKTETYEEKIVKTEVERLQEESLTTSSLYILLLEALGLEIIKDRPSQSLTTPFYIRCSYEQALKINKNYRFNTKICGENTWKIGIEGIDNRDLADDHLIPSTAEDRKEDQTKKAEEWIDILIDAAWERG